MAQSRKNWRGLLQEGARHLSVGAFGDAAYWFEAAHQKKPGHPLTCYALGRERMRQGRYFDAENLLREAYQGDPSLLPAAFCLVRLLGLHLERLKEASELLDRIAPTAADMGQSDLVLLLKGELELTKPKGFREASTTFNRVLDAGLRADAARDGLARSHNLEGIDLARHGKCDEALFALKKASRFMPRWAAPRVNMGAVFQRMGKPRRACKEYRLALVLEPENPTALYNLGKLYFHLGELERAAGCYRRLMENFPFYPGVRAALAELVRRRRETTAP